MVFKTVQAQDDADDAATEGAAAAKRDAEGDDAADAGKSEKEGDEEAWIQVEFLKNEINEKVENILQKTLNEAREKKGLTVLEKTVRKTLKQVIQIRESLLKRIKVIRKALKKKKKSIEDIKKGETN